MEYEAEVTIAAPADRVWAVLADLERWPEWTASMQQVEPLDGDAPLGVGSRVRVRQPSLPTVVWTISEWTPGAGFTWTASSPGVATAADHELSEAPDAGGATVTTVTLRVRQTGLLAGVLGLLIGGRTRRYMRMEADGLKQRSEA